VLPAVDHEELARREEDARRQAELLRRQEEELTQKRLDREAQEAREAQAEAERVAAKAASASVSASAEPTAAAAAEEEARVVAVKADKEKKAEAKKVEEAKATDLVDRRRKAETEAASIRAMMATPSRTLVAKKPDPVPEKPAVAKGTLHKPAGTPSARPAVSTTAGVAGKKRSQVGEPVVDLEGRRQQEKRNQNPWRYLGRSLQQLALGPTRWRSSQRPRFARRWRPILRPDRVQGH